MCLKDSYELIALYNLPRSWSVKSLAKIYETLFDIYNSKQFGTPENTVKALVEIGLTKNVDEINEVFIPDPTGITKDEASELKKKRTRFGGLVAKYAVEVGSYSNSAQSYGGTVCWTRYNKLDKGIKSKHLSRCVLSWISSYIILQSYGKIVNK